MTLLSSVRVNVSDATLLGAPLFPGPVLDKVWSDRCADLARAVDRLDAVSSQDTLILLRSSFSAPKVLHLLRCSPSVDHSCLQAFDSMLRAAIQRITNSSQGWRPGVRRVISLALPAF